MCTRRRESNSAPISDPILPDRSTHLRSDLASTPGSTPADRFGVFLGDRESSVAAGESSEATRFQIGRYCPRSNLLQICPSLARIFEQIGDQLRSFQIQILWFPFSFWIAFSPQFIINLRSKLPDLLYSSTVFRF